MKKKIVSVLMSVMMVASLSACGSSTEKAADANKEQQAADGEETTADAGSSDEVITLDMWHIWAAETESSKKPFEDAVAEFNAENPNIQITLDATENETYKTKMVTTIAANEAPDIYYYWSGGYMKNVVEAGKILPLNDYLTEEDMADIKEGTLSNTTFDDKIYGLGYSLAMGAFFVNTEMFEQNNIKVPETWDELVDACQKFIDLGITPMTVGAKEPWCIDMYLDMIMLRQAGFDAVNNALSKQGDFNTPDITEGAQKLLDLVDMGAFEEGALGISRDESEVPFYNGEVPMYFNGSWTCGNIEQDNCKVKGKIDVVKFPSLSENSDVNDHTLGVTDCFVINAETKYPDECAYALKEIMKKFSKSLYVSGAGIPTWNVDAGDANINPLIQKLAGMADEAKTYTLAWNTFLEGQDAELYMKKSQELFAKEITPEQFASDMQTVIG